MASYRVKITGLGSHRDTRKLVDFLMRQPGLGTDMIALGLQHPPLELPPVTQEALAHRMANKLTRMGAVCSVEEIREAHPKTESKEETWLDGKHLLDLPAGPAPGSHSAPLSRPPAEESHRLQWSLLAVVVLLLLAPLIYVARNNQSEQSSSTTASAPAATQNKREPGQQAAPSGATRSESRSTARRSTQPGQQTAHEQARRQQAHSQQMRERSRQTLDPRESAKMLQVSVQYNPYNAEAWKELEQKLRETGDLQGAEKAHKAYEQAQRIQNTLKSVANAFGTEPQVAVSTATITYTTSISMDDRTFYQSVDQLYEQISTQHPEKELLVENHNGSRTQRLRIVPGRTYPDTVEIDK